MELARFQSAVARLAVDRQLRERFDEAPASAAESLGLTPGEADLLAARIEGLAPFADSLIRKRLGAVRRLLPETARSLGKRFNREFVLFAGSRPSRGPWRHEQDALEFAGSIQSSLNDESRAVLLCEAGWLEAAMGRKLVVKKLPRGLAMWLRIRRRVRFWRFGRGANQTFEAPAAQESEESF